MTNIEKGLAEKVRFAIHIDRQREAEVYYADYIKHVNLLGKNKDIELLSKTNLVYANYQVKKAKDYTRKKDE